MGMFTQNELLLMIGVVGVLLLSIIILTVLDVREYLKNKKLDIVNEEEKQEEAVTFEEKEEKLEPIEVLEVKDEEVLISDVVDTPLMEEVIEPVKKVEPLSTFDEIDRAAEMSIQVNKEEEKDLYEKLEEATKPMPSLEDTITNFELEQERTAIISLDELLKKSDELYSNNEVMQYDDGNEPITIDEVMNRYNEANVTEEKEIPMVMEEVMETKDEAYSHKQSTPFISSIYGIEQNNNALEFENTATYEKLDRASNNEFMQKLREMSENK